MKFRVDEYVNNNECFSKFFDSFKEANKYVKGEFKNIINNILEKEETSSFIIEYTKLCYTIGLEYIIDRKTLKEDIILEIIEL